jgi:hypothetical protein
MMSRDTKPNLALLAGHLDRQVGFIQQQRNLHGKIISQSMHDEMEYGAMK